MLVSAPEQEQWLAEARTQNVTLNRDWPRGTRPDLYTEDRKLIAVACDYSKQQILCTAWPRRGFFAEFEKWVNSGATLPPPTAVSGPAQVHLAGKEVSR